MLARMTTRFRISALLLLLLHAVATATPTDAERVKASFKADMDRWTLEVRAAATPDARAKAWSTRPDPAVYGRKMWTIVAPFLGEEWALDPVAWFIGLTVNLQTKLPDGGSGPAFAKEIESVGAAIGTYHMKSPKLAPVCLAYAAARDPQSLALLEKIQANHAVQKVQGVAALAIAMRLRALGDDPELMSKRLKLLRKAVIDSADVEIQGITVAKLAQDELYVIRYLTKGRVAPDLAGTDSGSKPLKLSDYQGKIIVLLFWNSGIDGVVPVLEAMTSLKRTYADRPVAVIGVNNDTVENLRSMQKTDSDLLDFPVFSDPQNRLATEYRVGTWPMIYILDGSRKIQYAGPPEIGRAHV